MSVKKLCAKRLVKAALMTAIAIAVGVGAVWAVSQDTYFEATDASAGASGSHTRLTGDELLFPNATEDNVVRMYDGADKLNMGEGADTLHMSAGTDAIVFRGTDASEDGIISFDYCSGDPATVWTNSTVHMKVDQDGSGDYAMELRSDSLDITADEGDITITANEGDVIIDLGS